MLMGQLPGLPPGPGSDDLALNPVLVDLLLGYAPWRRPGPLAPYGPLGLPSVRTPQSAAPAPQVPGSPVAVPLAELMQRLAPYGRDGATGGYGRSPSMTPAAVTPPAAATRAEPNQRPRPATGNFGPGVATAGAAWEGIPVNHPRARGLEDAAWAIGSTAAGLAVPGLGTALTIAKELLTPAERQYRTLGPYVPGVPQTSQAMRTHWQTEGAIDAQGNVVRGGIFDPDGDGVYDSPAYRGQWDFSIAKDRSPWRQAPGGAIGELVNSMTGEVRRAPTVAEIAARARAVGAPPAAAQPGRRAAPSRNAFSAAARQSVAAQLARVGGSASSAFAGRDDRSRDRGAPARSGSGGSARSGIGPRGRQGAR